MRNIQMICIACLMLLTSCASRYKRINPETVVYNSISTDNGITMEYKYDVLTKKYKKKEGKKKLRVVAIKITNRGETEKVIGQDIRFVYQSGAELSLLDHKIIFKSLKQHPATHLLYMLFTPLNIYVSDGYNGSTSTIPVGLAIGPGLTLGNVLTSSGANRKFRKELEAKSLIGKIIKPGETVSGIIGVAAEGYDPIQIKVL